MDEVSLYTSELILCERMSGVNGQERKSLSESFCVCRFSLGPFQTTPPLPPFFTSIKPKQFPRKISKSRLKVWESMPETNDEEKKKKKRRKLKKKKKIVKVWYRNRISFSLPPSFSLSPSLFLSIFSFLAYIRAKCTQGRRLSRANKIKKLNRLFERRNESRLPLLFQNRAETVEEQIIYSEIVLAICVFRTRESNVARS